MMNILAYLKKKLTQGTHGTTGPRPGRDWLILLISAIVLIAASVLWNVWLFARIADNDFLAEESAGNVLKTYPAGAIGELFEKRAAMEAAYQSSYLFVDPSR